jgi:glycosidase
MRIRKDAHTRYQFDETLISPAGHLVLRDIRAAHIAANAMNAGRDEADFVSPAGLNAASIIQEVMHFAISSFVRVQDPDLFQRTLRDTQAETGAPEVDETLVRFVDTFPTLDVLREITSASEYLSQPLEADSNREITVEEMLICWLSNENPAYEPFDELIHDEDVRESSRYEQIIQTLSGERGADSGRYAAARRLVDILLEPVRRSPNSLKDQLVFMAGGEWTLELPDHLTLQIAIGGDLFAEEERALAAKHFAPGPPPPPPVPDYADEPEYEQFSPDHDWMPRVVMVAKNAYVWLDQLSKKYGRRIKRLDEIPDEELERLARWGISALWLIGVWRRSVASRTLKHWSGNPDAEASAYSLDDYVIADELGGPAALTGFRMACQRFGIRLASDMVPNHTGIDSKWVREHPDWFIQLPYSPYPAYSYTSESLSGDPDLTLQVEDGYYSRSDAAVTFRRYDHSTGDERFIYHGNDGTSMPWNDTAQLDFTMPEVREAVIQTILHVARQFPVIRFDAAMVLTRKHFRRLWYPAPGSGGGVPSRAEHGLSQAEFDRRMPAEFWREVVDRVASEVPDTLLLAEAFWLLEGYFVRTLGMHRVYNSAFMHMLKDEDNAKYREVMKNTIAFEPEVLKRYVNFMSNPDEETAIEQFGDGDKFFGVSTLLVTMPGLPMIAHGQVEGFREKYGMEYHRAYHDENVREDLVSRFEREITPLIRRRALFAEVTNFRLFDFETEHGIDENVFAYTNRRNGERALIVYNNRFHGSSGRLFRSTDLGPGAPTTPLGDALGLDLSSHPLIKFRDLTSNLEHIIFSDQLAGGGLSLSLQGYECHAFVDFEMVDDDEDGSLSDLAARLEGRGVESIEDATLDVRYKSLETLLVRMLNANAGDEDAGIDLDLLEEVAQLVGTGSENLKAEIDLLVTSVTEIESLSSVGERVKWPRSTRYSGALQALDDALVEGSNVISVVIGLACTRLLRTLEVAGISRLTKNILLRSGFAGPHSAETITSVVCGFARTRSGKGQSELSSLTDEARFGKAFTVHDFAGTTYYNKEAFDLGLLAAYCLDVMSAEAESAGRSEKDVARTIAAIHDEMKKIRSAHEGSEYDWDRLVSKLDGVSKGGSQKSGSKTSETSPTSTSEEPTEEET